MADKDENEVGREISDEDRQRGSAEWEREHSGEYPLSPDEHEQQPKDEVIAAGEHMDLAAMDEALANERRSGSTSPTGVVLSAPSAKMNPYVTEDMQGMEMTPKTFGPPQYGSPDPATAAGRLETLEDGHPLDGLPEDHPAAISEDYALDEQEAAELRTEQQQRARGEEPDDADDETKATEAAKAHAEENDVDLSEVEGTGPGGKITKADVQRAIVERGSQDDTSQDNND
jgi:pyruvate/2-oxoglutarate dehydrogenase complex dihydrolipoamide acyltransferase (E2) component